METVASYYLPYFSNSLKLYDQILNTVYSNSYCNASENPVLSGAQTLLALCRLSQMYLGLTLLVDFCKLCVDYCIHSLSKSIFLNSSGDGNIFF